MSIHKTSTGKYQVRYRLDTGKQKAKNFTRKKDAEKFELDVKLRRERGEQLDPSLGNLTVGDFFRDTFLPTRTTRVSTQRGYHVRWAKDGGKPWHVATKFDQMQLRAANTPATIHAWHREMRQAGASAAAIIGAHRLVVQIISFAVDLEYLPRLRIGGMSPAYAPSPKNEPWLPVDIEKARLALLTLPAALNRPGDAWTWARERDAMWVSLMAYVPMRLGEPTALLWGDVLEGGTIGPFVEVHRRVAHEGDDPEGTKTVPSRLIELPAPVRDELREWWMRNGRPETGLILPRTKSGAPWKQGSLTSWREQIWYRALDEAGIPREQPKHLRHSAVSMWIRSGRDIKSVADAAGHSIEVCARTYAHSFTRAMKATDVFDLDAAIVAARNPQREVGTG